MKKTIGFLLLFVSLSISSFAQTIDIKANNSDDPVTIDPDTGSLSLTASLDAGSAAGMNADWWVVADTPSGFYHLYITGTSWSWVPGISVTYQGPLVNIPPTPLPAFPSMGELGEYIFYVGIETNMNGQLDLDGSSGASTSRSTLEADTGMNGQSTDVSPGSFRLRVDRAVASKLAKLAPGKKKFIIGAGFDETAKNTIREAIANGPFKEYYDCIGISFEEVTSVSEAELLIVRHPISPQVDHNNVVQHLPAGYRSIPNSPFKELVISSEITLHVEQTSNIPSDKLDLWSLFIHELSHFLGIPTQHDDNYPENGVFDNFIAPGQRVGTLISEDKTLLKTIYPACNCVNNAGTSTANDSYVPSFNANPVCGGPWIGNWILVNFLADDDEGEWDEDDLSGIGMWAAITESAWVERDEVCAVTYSYSVDENNRHSKKAESINDKCPSKPPLGWFETGRLEFKKDNKFMIEYFDPAPGNDIVAFKWMRR